MGQLLFGFFGLGIFGLVPMVVALVAIVDVVRVGASWYWIWIILAFPVLGAAAYFVVVRSGWAGGGSRAVSPDTARRLQARRRLRELQVQLGHWRGPGVLAEAGEELLVLGKHKEAEKHFREARENGAGVEDVNFGLAQALQMQGRYAEAVPLLDELVKVEPDANRGRALLQLGRSLDESGQKDRAETVLRQVLERRTIIEAQVRLARILLARGDKEEARRLLHEVKNDAAGLPRYLRREHRSWIWTARRLRSGNGRLPKPHVEGGVRPGYRLRMALTAAAATVVVLLLVGYGALQVRAQTRLQVARVSLETAQALGAEIQELDIRYPWTRGGDLARIELTAADADRYLRVRRGLEPALQRYLQQRRDLESRIKAVARRGVAHQIGQGMLGFAPYHEGLANDVELRQSVLDTLVRERMGPRELTDLLTLVEWRFLRREEAKALGLAEFHRWDFYEARSIAQAGEEASGHAVWDRERQKLASFERQASAAVDLAPATRTLLESRRADLERFEPATIEALLTSLDPAN